ncbi:hypothetical protein [Clostridium sp. 1001275B_160808_H3]|uniref:hypothetical protein n=1 Tax=Clostridium sp. 1001275B_160808_H3 TaxID=2787110 RepID=UPI001A9B6A66|nr:hypothetical protein [Clostridium sp. 1001275B_160808_H3]
MWRKYNQKRKAYWCCSNSIIRFKTGLGGSEVLIDFCSKCGKVIEMIVENPDKIK